VRSDGCTVQRGWVGQDTVERFGVLDGEVEELWSTIVDLERQGGVVVVCHSDPDHTENREPRKETRARFHLATRKAREWSKHTAVTPTKNR